MRNHLQFGNEKSRHQARAVRHVGPYMVHFAPVSTRIKVAVSKRGQVVHRCEDLDAGEQWANRRCEEIHHNKETP